MNFISDFLVSGGYLLTVGFDGAAWQTGVPGTICYDFIFGGSKNGGRRARTRSSFHKRIKPAVVCLSSAVMASSANYS
jgi:hypothetical protein